MIDPVTRLCHPYPKAVCVKAGSYPVLDALGVAWNRRRDYSKASKGRVTLVGTGAFGTGAFGADVVSGPVAARYIVFPRYEAGARPALTPMSRAEAVLRLTDQSFNFGRFRGRGTALLADVVGSARCYSLVSGEIRETVALLDRMTREGAG
jgi:hypothetical protein